MTMQPFLLSATLHKVGSIPIQFESDVVRARNLGSMLAQEMKFEKTSCIRIGTAVSELTRNMIEHANGGIVEFSIALRKDKSPGVVIVFRDKGKGISNLNDIQTGDFVLKKGMGVGLSGSQRLMDDFDIRTQPGKGTTITAAKWLPVFVSELSRSHIESIQQAFEKTIKRGDASMVDTINAQNNEVHYLLRTLQERNEQIEIINQELEETNKGVVALNRELEDKAIAIEKAKLQAEMASKAKSEFLAHMSHEIRTPMNAILGFTELLQQKISDPTHVKYLQAISSGGKALLGIINDILDLSKIEAGKMELHFHSVNLHALLNEVAQIFKHRTEEKQIEFLLEIDPAVPRALVLDDIRMRQILINLVGNAVKFTDQGFVKLIVKRYDKVLKDSETDLIFIVEDTGIGIPQDQIDLIFQAFEQQKNQDLNKYGGTGLGLTITSRLVSMMGGNITVESNLNKGSKFIVSLSNIQIADDNFSNQETLSVNVDNIKFKPSLLLLADDIHTNRDLVKSMLEDSNLNIIEAINGEEAIQMARQHLPDMILMDIKMPVMDGFQAITILKNDENLKQIPVVAFTASALKEDQIKILSAGFNGCLTKPVSKEDLITEFEKYLEFEDTSQQHTTEDHPSELHEYQDKLSGEALDKMLSMLGGDLFAKWETLRNTFIITEIITFAKETAALGQLYGAARLTAWGKKLDAEASAFDLDNLPGTLNQYPKIIEHYGKLRTQ